MQSALTIQPIDPSTNQLRYNTPCALEKKYCKDMDKTLLIKKYSEAIENGRAAIFAGAGFSANCGFVDWKGLLKDVASELNASIKDYTNLVELAQYYVNTTRNRNELSNTILNAFPTSTEPNENHNLLASLPITTYWTTNFDNLIEKSLEANGKVVDVKSQPESLSTSKDKRNAIVYKMHGDVSNPSQTILTRDEFEQYESTHKPFLDSFSYDLTNKTFLFIGLSFDDPNLKNVLKYVRRLYDKNQRRHYYILRKVKQENESEEDFQYRSRQQELFVEDLKNYGIETVYINEYSEITDILLEIRKRYSRRTVFISGAACDYAPYNEIEVKTFISDLSASIIRKGFRIVNGYGLGFGNEVISGAIQALNSLHKPIDGNLIIRPFPQGLANPQSYWSQYRREMISLTGVSIFLFGNKIGKNAGRPIDSYGMREEYEISKANGNLLIPVGATGHMSKKLWDEQNASFDASSSPVPEDMAYIGDSSKSLKELHDKIMEILDKLG